MTLDTLKAGTLATITRLDLAQSDRARVLGLGMIPGAQVQLLQPKPAVIVRIEHTTLALESVLAAGISVITNNEDCNLAASM